MNSRNSHTRITSGTDRSTGRPGETASGAKPPTKPQAPDRCPQCQQPYDMNLQVDRVRCCLKCGLVVNFADPKGLERAMASRTAVQSAGTGELSESSEPKSFWRSKISWRTAAVGGFGVLVLYVAFRLTQRVIRVSPEEAMELIRQTTAGPPEEVFRDMNKDAPDEKRESSWPQ